ncbi:hypothetical protein SAMN05880561_1222 [Rhizobium sp. RU33A]|nr:hypothetical protein SAMN05880561_1222 [Rhizobium sp. RU33A]
MGASMISQRKALEDENHRLRKRYAGIRMQGELLREARGRQWRGDPTVGSLTANASICLSAKGWLGKPRRWLRKPWRCTGVSFALACRSFDVSETCYRYSTKLNDENEQIADLLIGGLTRSKKTCFGL